MASFRVSWDKRMAADDGRWTSTSELSFTLVLVPDYCDPADLKEQFRKEMGARRKAAAAKVALSKNAVGTLDDDFYSTPYETQRVGKGSSVRVLNSEGVSGRHFVPDAGTKGRWKYD
ncbi:hypothetical protein HPB47_022914 [Ixodes persulcatus]|uniref:Uncharacterized protein n=1 Tax=Ixodes persulcatus TaxID=34615 RepID=A0AC60QBQ8_IXOPE|nr:hypothetical protein HPB47_022914 [Ixodes persulcatus]